MEFTKEELCDLVKGFESKLEAYNKAFEDFKSHFENDFMAKAEENYKDWDHKTRLGEFTEKYKDSIEPLIGDIRAIERDDEFDPYDKIFSNYDESDHSIEEADYVANAVASLTDQITKLKEKFGAENVDVESKADGSVEVQVDDKPLAEAETIIKEDEAAPEEDEDAKLEAEYEKYEKDYRL